MRARRRFFCCTAILIAGCVSTGQLISLPSNDSLVRDQLVIHSNFPLPRHHRLVEELVARRHDVVDRLRLPVSDEPIHVYLFESADRFRAFMLQQYPAFPDRRAFFVETDTRLTIFAHWGDRVAEDLRHEVTHGYLHTMIPRLPLWIDEGLAEYFEVPRGERGLNQSHMRTLLDEGQLRWPPDMARLELLESPGDMTQRDYAEAWAWIHLFLESTPERRDMLRNHLARIRMTGTAPPLADVLANVESNANQCLANHLRALSVRP